ncbi:uncharacterized protein GIQ15_05446 [Arthroderma uncinatum]|uniref:uncharacterized protein n=1 Tax=Arthroderma uncinatum TaxID=74035 RepID=UPI00144A733B|nr:uncharacterized protein GIQ15_05446 [Arthroderma uncinatum]KAF3480099.1 hypothetical protein GIQ15_05446 [Arthroderma uncinatum]
MNAIRQIEALNKTELENAVSPEASWHADYRDTAYIYIGGLPFDISEGDILTIFSQYGNPVHLNLVRDKETGKSRGFAFLKYEDQRSTDLAVDNLGGATVLGRLLRVDHVRYKRREEEGTEDNLANVDENGEAVTRERDGEEKGGEEKGSRRKSRRDESEEPKRPARQLLKEEVELQRLMDEHDDEDPMKEYLVKEKKEEVENALALVKVKSKSKSKEDLVRNDHALGKNAHHTGAEGRDLGNGQVNGDTVEKDGIGVEYSNSILP